MKPRDESGYLRAITRLAQMLGYTIYHTHDSRRSNPGWPDLVLCRPPRLIVAELKSARGRLRRAQVAWLDLLGEVPGIETYVWRDGTDSLDEIARILR